MKNGQNRKKHTGFTIIEVMIFLAISGVLIVGIIAGSGATIARYRYNDSVQDLAQLLRAQYSSVINTQIAERDTNTYVSCVDSDKPTQTIDPNFPTSSTTSSNSGRGRTDCLVYGTMITFGGNGEVVNLSSLVGADVFDLAAKSTDNTKLDSMDDLQLLQFSGANNLSIGDSFSHKLEWGATIQKVERPSSTADNILKATLIIFRSPRDGAIRTYVSDEVFLNDSGEPLDISILDDANDGEGMFAKFERQELLMCVGSDDSFAFDQQRRMIRVAKDGHNSSAVELVDMDSEKNLCL